MIGRVTFLVLLGIASSQKAAAADRDRAIDLIRSYCKACHALGAYRFLTSEDNQLVWEYITTRRTDSGELWVTSIIDTLTWPSEEPPAPDARTSSGKRYMPLGSKRELMAQDTIGDVTVRQYVVESLTDSSWDPNF